jgi:TPR repeat protein
VRHFLLAAAEAEDPEALADLGAALTQGAFGLPRDFPAALDKLERAGSAGHVDALLSAGAMY